MAPLNLYRVNVYATSSCMTTIQHFCCVLFALGRCSKILSGGESFWIHKYTNIFIKTINYVLEMVSIHTGTDDKVMTHQRLSLIQRNAVTSFFWILVIYLMAARNCTEARNPRGNRTQPSLIATIKCLGVMLVLGWMGLEMGHAAAQIDCPGLSHWLRKWGGNFLAQCYKYWFAFWKENRTRDNSYLYVEDGVVKAQQNWSDRMEKPDDMDLPLVMFRRNTEALMVFTVLVLMTKISLRGNKR